MYWHVDKEIEVSGKNSRLMTLQFLKVKIMDIASPASRSCDMTGSHGEITQSDDVDRATGNENPQKPKNNKMDILEAARELNKRGTENILRLCTQRKCVREHWHRNPPVQGPKKQPFKPGAEWRVKTARVLCKVVEGWKCDLPVELCRQDYPTADHYHMSVAVAMEDVENAPEIDIQAPAEQLIADKRKFIQEVAEDVKMVKNLHGIGKPPGLPEPRTRHFDLSDYEAIMADGETFAKAVDEAARKAIPELKPIHKTTLS